MAKGREERVGGGRSEESETGNFLVLRVEVQIAGQAIRIRFREQEAANTKKQAKRNSEVGSAIWKALKPL